MAKKNASNVTPDVDEATAAVGAAVLPEEKQELTADEKSMFAELDALVPRGTRITRDERFKFPKVPGIGFRMMKDDPKVIDKHEREKGIIPVTSASPEAVRKAVGLRNGQQRAIRGGMIVGYGRTEDSEAYYEECRELDAKRVGQINQGVNPNTGDQMKGSGGIRKRQGRSPHD